MANIFQNIFKKSGLSKSPSRSDSVIGVDIGSSSIKVVQLKKKAGKAVLETYGELSLGPFADGPVGSLTNLNTDVLVQALKDVIKESQVTTNSAAMSIPSSSSLLFVLELPGIIEESKLSDIVPIEARRYVPLPISEVTLDWWMIPRRESFSAEASEDERGVEKIKTEVLVAAIHNDAMNKYREIFEKAELTNGFFEIEIFSNIRGTLGHDLSTVLIADFGASKTKLAIIDNGIIKKSHIITKGSFDISNNISKALDIPFAKAEEQKKEFGLIESDINKNIAEISKLVIDYIFSDMREVISNYERKYNKVVNKIILTGGGAMLKGLRDAATETFGADIVLSNPFAKTQSPVFLAQVLESVGPPFAVAVGLALKKLQ